MQHPKITAKPGSRPSPAHLLVLAALAGCGGFREASSTPADAAGGTDAEARVDGAAQDAGGSDLDAAAAGDHTSPGVDAGSDACTPSCSGRTCGLDPTCGVSCGTCPSTLACATTSTNAACAAPTIVWEVDGVVVTQLATFESFYYPSQGTYGVDFPHWGRSVQAWTPQNPTPGTIVSCPAGGPGTLSLITSDNSYADLGALPARWKNLTFVSCGAQSSGDTVTARDLTITSVSPARIAGSYDILVQGAGPRAGSTLHVHGVFDLVPQPQ